MLKLYLNVSMYKSAFTNNLLVIRNKIENKKNSLSTVNNKIKAKIFIQT